MGRSRYRPNLPLSYIFYAFIAIIICIGHRQAPGRHWASGVTSVGDEVVLGLQWGDEGKGKFVDERASRHAAVVRFQGGANAGHTVVVHGRTQVLHQVPTGALHSGVCCVIAAGCAVDPQTLRREVESLGLEPGRLVVSPRAQVVAPWHTDIDGAEEALRGAGAVGTTRRGIGPTYAAKAGRWGLTVGAFVDPSARAATLDAARPWLTRWLTALGLPAARAHWPEAAALAAWLQPFVADDLEALRQARRRGSILFEGQLGLLRDPDRGAYPFVTGASLLPPAALLPHGARIFGVAKPYVTMVGAGPFPTEVFGEAATALRTAGGEFGATTGRPRRVGWLDLPALRYAARATGATDLAVQVKREALAALDAVPVCTEYAGWDEASGYPLPHQLAAVRPVYTAWPVPRDDAGAVAFAERMAAAVGLPLTYVGTDAARGAHVEPVPTGARR
jgi:adenylosuccinate synthase